MTKTGLWLATFVVIFSASVASADGELEEQLDCPADGTRTVLQGEGAILSDAVSAARAAGDFCVFSNLCSGYGPVACVGPLRGAGEFICSVCGILLNPQPAPPPGTGPTGGIDVCPPGDSTCLCLAYPDLCNPQDLDGLNRCVENPEYCAGCSVANADVGLGNTWLMAIGLAYLGWRLRRQAGRR